MAQRWWSVWWESSCTFVAAWEAPNVKTVGEALAFLLFRSAPLSICDAGEATTVRLEYPEESDAFEKVTCRGGRRRWRFVENSAFGRFERAN
jgi:hypothetical protein